MEIFFNKVKYIIKTQTSYENVIYFCKIMIRKSRFFFYFMPIKNIKPKEDNKIIKTCQVYTLE